jgi:hypothetical protein
MSSKLLRNLALGVVAIASSAGAFANTSADSAATVFLNVMDQTTGAYFLFDTGVSATAFPDTSYSKDLSTDANWTSFIGAKGANDVLLYSVVGGYQPNAAGVSTLLTTSSIKPSVTTGATIANDAAGVLGTGGLLTQVNNPSGGSSYIASAVATGLNTWGVTTGYDAKWTGDLGMGSSSQADLASLGTALSFYQVASNGNSGKATTTISTFLSQWNLTTAGLLTYGSAGSVPLPAPLMLLLSGLGLMGLVARRKQSGLLDGLMGGAAA